MTLDSQIEPQSAQQLPATAEQLNTFNFLAVLQGRASSAHTHRAYARWIDRYLSDLTELEPTTGKKRRERLENLPLDKILPALNPTLLRSWLGKIAAESQGKQGLNQARAAIVTLASLLAEANWLDDYTAVSLTNVRVPRAESGQRKGRWLSVDQIKLLIKSAENIATSHNQRIRNAVIMRMLCLMALRREELTDISWGDMHTQAGRPVLLVHGKGSKAALVDIPNTVVQIISEWETLVSEYDQDTPTADSPLVRRVYKGGSISPYGLSTDAVWRIVKDAAEQGGIGRVAPHDLRRSVAGNLEMSGVPVETISRLLRHSNIAVTQQYLSKLPRQNEGALLMADLLELD